MVTQDRRPQRVCSRRKIRLFGVVTIFIVGCSYEPEHIPFEPFVSREQTEGQINQIAGQLRDDGDNKDLLVQYGILLSRNLQYDVSHGSSLVWFDRVFSDKYRDFYTVDSIVDLCVSNRVFNRTLFEEHVRNILYLTHDRFSGPRGSERLFDKLKILAEQLLSVDEKSKTGIIGLYCYYVIVNDREQLTRLMEKIAAWNELPGLVSRLRFQGYRLDRSLFERQIIRNGISSRDDFCYLKDAWGSWSSTSYGSKLDLIDFVSGMELEYGYHVDLPILKMLSLPFFLSFSPLITVRFMNVSSKDYYERYCFRPAWELAKDDSASRGDILMAIIWASTNADDSVNAIEWVRRIPEQTNEKVLLLPDMGMPNSRIAEYGIKAGNTTLPQKLFLANWELVGLASYRSSDELRRWIKKIDSLREVFDKKDRFVSPYEITALSEILVKEHFHDEALIGRTGERISTYFVETGIWLGSAFINGMVANGKKDEARRYLEKVISGLPQSKKSLFISLSRGYDDIIHAIPPHADLMDVMKGLRFPDRETENLVSYNISVLSPNMGFIGALEKIEARVAELDEIKRAVFYQSLKRLYEVNSRWQDAARITDTLTAFECRELPRSLVDKAYYFFKLAKMKESDSIFALIEYKTPHFNYQYETRARILIETNRKSEARQLLYEKIHDPQERQWTLGRLAFR